MVSIHVELVRAPLESPQASEASVFRIFTSRRCQSKSAATPSKDQKIKSSDGSTIPVLPGPWPAGSEARKPEVPYFEVPF